MAPLISANAEMLLPDRTWEKGRFSLFSGRIVFDGKSRQIDQTFRMEDIQCKRELFQRRRLLFSRETIGVSFFYNTGVSFSFCFEDEAVPYQILSILEEERVNASEPEQPESEMADDPLHSIANKDDDTGREEADSEKNNSEKIELAGAEQEKKEPLEEQIESDKHVPASESISTTEEDYYEISSDETDYVVIRINKVNSLGRIIQKDEKGNLTIKLENGIVYKVNLDSYLKRKLIRYVKKPEGKDISPDDDNGEINKRGPYGQLADKKKKINLKDATKKLVIETKELLDVVTPLRKEADRLYDELRALQKSYGINEPDEIAEGQKTLESDISSDKETTAAHNEEDSVVETISTDKYEEPIESKQINDPRVEFGVGSIIRYGEYKHNPLSWVVIRNDAKGYLLLSLEIVAQKEFNKSFGVWSNCELKKWLNSSFRKKAFSEEEASYMYVGPTITSGESTTQAPGAHLFVLNDDEYRELVPDEYRQGLARRSNGEKYAVKWWLRTSGETTKYAYYVDEKGNVLSGPVNNDKIGVRPVMWVTKNQLIIGESIITAENESGAVNDNSLPTSDSVESRESTEKTNDTIEIVETGKNIQDENTEEQVKKRVKREFRSYFVQQCKDFSEYCAGFFSEKRLAEIRQHTEDRPLPYLFDLANCRFSHMENDYVGYEMPMYFHTQNETLVRCRRDGIYKSELLSSYMLFSGERFRDQERILSCAITDSIGKQRTSVKGIEMMCLMPDAVDDFNHSFRSQISGLFQVPRSIALAYSIFCNDQKARRKTPKEFIVVDYDCEEFIAIKIVQSKDEKGRPFFIRWGRVSVPGNHLSYRSLAAEYVSRYKEKNGLILSDTIVKELINTKLLQQILLDPERRPVLLVDGDSWVNIWPDYDIVDEIHAKVMADIKEICGRVDVPVCSVCSFGWSNQEHIYGIDSMETGCIELCRRYIQHETLWEEYLPKLELGVHLDGTFSDLLLIGEKERHQRISSAYLGNTIQFEVKNGVITLDKGKKYYDLPLVREVYGSMNKEKMARFTPKEPFLNDESVHLRIDYRYGDVDSYKLIALFDDDRDPLVSEWCDADLLQNPAPVYIAQDSEPMYASGNSAVVNWFRTFYSNINAPQMPWNGDSLYDPPKNPYKLDKKPYSRYLEGINGPYGFPFRQVRRFFDHGNQTPEVKKQIQKMFDDGIFSCMVGVLQGKLPKTHKMEIGSSKKYPNYDQRECLISNLRRVCASLGILYTYNSPDVEGILRGISICNIIEIWAPVTTYVRRGNDPYKVWDKFSETLYMMEPDGRSISELRAISNVCFLTQDWVFELYHGPNGRRDIDHLINCIKSVLFSNEWQEAKLLPYNAKRIRDVLELLLCITLLKREDPTILDTNSQETKSIVRQLKIIDNEMRRLKEEDNIDKGKDFNCRISGIESDEYKIRYQRVNKVIYALIVTLTGGGSINLVGFKED